MVTEPLWEPDGALQQLHLSGNPRISIFDLLGRVRSRHGPWPPWSLLIEFQSRHPERYSIRNLSALQRRVKVRRREAVQRLMCDVKDLTQNIAARLVQLLTRDDTEQSAWGSPSPVRRARQKLESVL
jgi:hypothetical protein